MFCGEAGCDRVHLALRLRDADARLEAGDREAAVAGIFLASSSGLIVSGVQT
jgi:hypothetical protein